MYRQLLVYYFIIICCTPASLLRAQELDSADVELMRQRIRQLKAADPPRPDSVQKLLKSMQGDGSWKTIDYSSLAVSHWSPYEHLTDYVVPLAKAFANPESSLYQNEELAKGLHKALGFWLDHNFTSRNWWPNDIGIPKTLGDILILMDEEVTSPELLKALNQMRGGYIRQTGQNKVWRAEIQLKIGLLKYVAGRVNILGSAERIIDEASSVLQDEVVVRGKEGIQPDWSFHQHGVQQQFGNYGLSYAISQAEWAYILKNTPYQYSEEKISILRHYVLKGLSQVVWKGVMDISGIGRQIFPDRPSEKGQRVIQLLQLMAKADPEHASAYQQVTDYNLGKESQPSLLRGNTYFWRSGMMVDRSDNSYFSIRMCSKIIQSTESGNGENLLGTHLSDGATYLYQTAEEYRNIFPVWNWHRIPGVTSYSDGRLPEPGWRGLHNGSDFVGGVSDSSNGAAVMLFKRNGLSARKSWFFVPDGLVCLGAGIDSDRNTNVLTTVNQTLLNGKITVKTKKGTETLIANQDMESPAVAWVHHNGTGYFFLQREQVHAGAATQRGNWHRVYENGSPRTVSRKIFNLWVDHGSKPQNGSYAYGIVPDISLKKFTGYAEKPSVEILQNTSSLQAIQDSKARLAQMVFYQPGSVELNESTEISADAPCILMAQQVNQGLKVTIAAPPKLSKEVTIFVTGRYSGKRSTYDSQKNQTTVKFDLPEGIYAGQSVNRMLNRRE